MLGSPSGQTIWLTGLPGSGKTTLSLLLHEQIGVHKTRLLDGDALRRGLNLNLGFDRIDRQRAVFNAGELAIQYARQGLTSIVALISPYNTDRQAIRHMHKTLQIPFFEIYVSTPIDVCKARDPKGLYARAERGDITGLTGLDDPYEVPLTPELVLPTHQLSEMSCVERILEVVRLPAASPSPRS